MQLRCVLFRNVVILVGQCGLDKTIYSNLVRTKLLNTSKHIIVCDSPNPWTRPERDKSESIGCFIKKNIFIW